MVRQLIIDNLSCNVNQLWATIPDVELWKFVIIVGFVVFKSEIT
jgi:hypothetical protein